MTEPDRQPAPDLAAVLEALERLRREVAALRQGQERLLDLAATLNFRLEVLAEDAQPGSQSGPLPPPAPPAPVSPADERQLAQAEAYAEYLTEYLTATEFQEPVRPTGGPGPLARLAGLLHRKSGEGES